MNQAQLHDLLSYDSNTGIFVWLVNRKGPGAKIGERAGSQHDRGYRTIKVNQITYAEHHLAWLYIHGVLPEYVDHTDRDPSNNRIKNLRLATRSENQQNRIVQRNNKLGVKGVMLDQKTGRYHTTFTINKQVSRTIFNTLDEAKCWRKTMEDKFHPYKPN